MDVTEMRVRLVEAESQRDESDTAASRCIMQIKVLERRLADAEAVVDAVTGGHDLIVCRRIASVYRDSVRKWMDD